MASRSARTLLRSLRANPSSNRCEVSTLLDSVRATVAPLLPSLAVMLATAQTFAIEGVEAVAVSAEVDINRGLPAFSVVGLPDAAVRESRERVRAAISNTGYEFPLQRIIANLAPADLRKAGPGFDLALAAAILVASGQLPAEPLARVAFVGELALDGSIRPTRGALAMAELARRRGIEALVAAPADAAEAGMIEDLGTVPLTSLRQLGPFLEGGQVPSAPPEPVRAGVKQLPDMADLRGQPTLRYGLEVAAAGAHSMLVVGPPGAGKSMAARRLPSILPPLAPEETVEVRRIASASGRSAPMSAAPPFRAPHHTISAGGLVGGGNPTRAGEITLAHRGVLLLDELPEFPRASLEALRQPLESGEVTISRARGALSFPARFQLLATANPCPCGRGEASPECRCTPDRIDRYQAKLSGPLADRIDMTLAVEQPDSDALRGEPGECSARVRDRVIEARLRQRRRWGEGVTNSSIGDTELAATMRLGSGAAEALDRGKSKLGLSGRGWSRCLRVARTCADLAGSEEIEVPHVGAALSLRRRSATVV